MNKHLVTIATAVAAIALATIVIMADDANGEEPPPEQTETSVVVCWMEENYDLCYDEDGSPTSDTTTTTQPQGCPANPDECEHKEYPCPETDEPYCGLPCEEIMSCPTDVEISAHTEPDLDEGEVVTAVAPGAVPVVTDVLPYTG